MRIISFFAVLFTAILFCNCNSAKQAIKTNTVLFEEKPSFQLGQVYFQKWVAGVQGGGSGIHMYFIVETNKNHVVFDSVYFRGMKAKMQLGKIGYLASFNTVLNQKVDIIMDGDSSNEFGNKLPKENDNYPFNLRENECVIQYSEKGKTKYYKVTDVVEKQAEYYPSAPNNKEKQ